MHHSASSSRPSWLLLATLTLAGLAACKKTPPPSGSTAAPSSPAASAASPVASASASAASTRAAPKTRRTGSAIARSSNGKALYVADEDVALVRKIPLPLAATEQGTTLSVGGPPAQVVAIPTGLLVTVRDPGALVWLKESDDGTLAEEARVALPGDAWGIGLSPDGKTAVVSSAWTHTLSVIDVVARKVTATLDVPREPRGVAFAPDGKHAYVSHLMGTSLTRVDLESSATVARVALPASPDRAPRGAEPSASLGYALTFDDTGTRLFVPRHALGTASRRNKNQSWASDPIWFGSSTVDTLIMPTEKPLIQPRPAPNARGDLGRSPDAPPTSFVQPRDVVYVSKTRQLLVCSEGTDELVSLDATAVTPHLFSRNFYRIEDLKGEKTMGFYKNHQGAPTGVALSEDENHAYVWARTTREVVHHDISGSGAGSSEAQLLGPFPEPQTKTSEKVAQGRRVFHWVGDNRLSGGLACAGCHPEGRDDGFTWHEVIAQEDRFGRKGTTPPGFVGHPEAIAEPENLGFPRQTPMLAGRVAAAGPFGWHAQNKDLTARIVEGISLHRWPQQVEPPTLHQLGILVNPVVTYVREGLRPPPKNPAPLTELELQGKKLFEDAKTQCTSCHPSAGDMTTRAAVPLNQPLPTRAGYASEENQLFKVPSLLFVGGTAPYYHDGSSPSLQDLIEKNGARMGNTSHLTTDEKKALVAYLERL